MAAPPYKINDRRSSSGYDSGANNALFQGATQSRDRKWRPNLAQDTKRNISHVGRRTLMTLSRNLFANFPAVEGVILEQANLAVSSFIPQFYGTNKKWGDRAEEWLLNWFEVMNVAGWPHDGASYTNLLIIAALRDGDMGTLLTETEDHYPQIQIIPGHRIGSPMSYAAVDGGEYDGALICDGVILNEYGRAIAYRVLDEDGNYEKYRDISARDMFLSYELKWSDQLRGLPAPASSMFVFQDVDESQKFELLAQKLFSSIYLLEHNEGGEADAAKSAIQSEATFDASGNKTVNALETIMPGVRYMKAGTGSKFDFLRSERPSQDARAFQETMIRDAFQGLEWNYFFSIKPGDTGGAAMRIVVEKINRVIAKRQRLVAKAMKRIVGFGISKAIKLKLLPEEVEWWKWEFQGPAEITADKKYDSSVDIEEYRTGFTALKRICAKRGLYWEDVQDQKIEERVRLEKKCKEANPPIDPENVQMLTPNGRPEAKEEDPDAKKDAEGE